MDQDSNKFEKIYDKVLKDVTANKRVSLLKVIRANCLECCGFSGAEVDNCTCADTCVLYPFRKGVRPKAMRIPRKPKNPK